MSDGERLLIMALISAALIIFGVVTWDPAFNGADVVLLAGAAVVLWIAKDIAD